MSLRLIFLIYLLLGLASNKGFGQILADFTFDDTSNLPASLKKNAAGSDALHINPNARSDGEGVYTVKDPKAPNQDQNIDLEVSEDLFNHTESIYLEFDFRAQEDFAWLIYSGYAFGYDLFRFGHANYADRPEQRGFHIRYSTKADPSTLITSGYVGPPLERGERATIGFWYDKESGTAYIYKNGEEIWQTPEQFKTPGFGLHWQTAKGRYTIGANMDGGGSTTPSLYRFRAFEKPCMGAFPPMVKNDTICGSGTTTLTASGGKEGQYRWYTGEAGNLQLIAGEFSSSLVTPLLRQTTTFHVAVATEICESAPVPVKVFVVQEPLKPKIRYTEACGPGEVTIYLEDTEENTDYWWYSNEGSELTKENSALSIFVSQDTVLYVKAENGFCESEALPVYIMLQEPPMVDAGPDITIMKGESAELYATGDFISCTWSGPQNFKAEDTKTITVSPEISQVYVVTGINETGCQNSDTVTVFVQTKFPVPNAFSPNSDGRNDSWIIPNIENYPNCKILVFNRWGNEVFSSEGYQQPWDGTMNGQELPVGTYYYTLQLGPDHEPVKGSIVILK